MKKIKRTLSYLLLGQEGGKNRFQIIELLRKRPYNINQIAETLDLNYRTVKHHVDVMVENGVITPSKESGYGNVYFLSDRLENNIEIYEDIVQKFDKIITSPALLKNLLKNSDVAVIITDEEGKALFWNRGAEEIFGYDEEDILGKFVDIFETKQVMDGIFEKVDKQDKLIREEKIRKGTGKDTHIELIVESVVDENKEFLGYSILAIDISKRKELRKEKQQQYKILQSIMENTNSQLVYFDRDFNFVHVNKAYAESTGYSPEELIGRNHFELFPDEENRKIFEEVRDTGESVSFKDKPFEFPNDPERGTTYWDWTLSPVKNEKDEVQGLVLSLIETTDRVQHEKEMEEARERIEFLNSLIESIKDVNQEIVKTEDFDEVIQNVPSILLRTKKFVHITLSMIDDEDIIRPFSSAGAHKDRVWDLTREGEGDAPECVKKALKEKDEVIVEGFESFCEDCPFSQDIAEHKTVIIPLIQDGSLIGMMSTCYEPGLELDEKTLDLLHEVADDLVYAKRTKTAQKRLKNMEEQYKDLIEKAPFFIERLNTDLEYIYVNPQIEEELGIKKEDFIGNTAGEVGMPDDVVQRWESALRKVIETGEENEVEITYPLEDGEQRYHNKIIPEFDEDGSVGSLLCFTRKIE